MTIGIIGSGKMGQALIKWFLAQGISRSAIWVSDTEAARRREVRRRFGVRVTDDNGRVARACDVIILAVKPQQFPDVVPALGRQLKRRSLVISIAAGITLRWLEARLRDIPVIRVMPNLPATVGCAFSAIAAGHRASGRHRAIARSLFGAVGDVVELPERHFDAITAVSGSGPAYVFFLVHAWERAARSLGLPEDVARRAIRRTLEGSRRLLEASGEPPEVLMAKVASKRGTTEAALNVLERRRVLAHFIEALRAAARRSRELSL
jgi:pyrroline-5-carboxylate reductase